MAYKYNIIVALTFLIGCKNTPTGTYVSDINSNDSLILYSDFSYKRFIDNDLISKDKYFIIGNNLSFDTWVNKGELIYGDTLGVNFYARYNFFSGECYHIDINSDGYGYKRVE